MSVHGKLEASLLAVTSCRTMVGVTKPKDGTTSLVLRNCRRRNARETNVATENISIDIKQADVNPFVITLHGIKPTMIHWLSTQRRVCLDPDIGTQRNNFVQRCFQLKTITTSKECGAAGIKLRWSSLVLNTLLSYRFLIAS